MNDSDDGREIPKKKKVCFGEMGRREEKEYIYIYIYEICNG